MKASWYFKASETCTPKESVTFHNNSLFKMYCQLQNYCHSIRIWLHDHVHTSYTHRQMFTNWCTYLLVLESTTIYLKFTLKCSYMFRSMTIMRELILEPS
jgi:hypothetical protein